MSVYTKCLWKTTQHLRFNPAYFILQTLQISLNGRLFEAHNFYLTLFEWFFIYLAQPGIPHYDCILTNN